MKIKGHAYWAKDVTIGKSNQEETEKISVVFEDFENIKKRVLNRGIDDERTILGVLMASALTSKLG